VGFLFAIAKSWDEKFTPPKPRKFFQENSLKLYEINSEGGESQRDHKLGIQFEPRRSKRPANKDLRGFLFFPQPKGQFLSRSPFRYILPIMNF